LSTALTARHAFERLFDYNGAMSPDRLDEAHRLLAQAVEALSAAAEAGSDAELISVLSLCEGMVRRLDRVTVDAVATLERRGAFTERGYKSATQALSDLLGWEGRDARRRVTAAEQIAVRTGMDGTTLPARLPATASRSRATTVGRQLSGRPRHSSMPAATCSTTATSRIAVGTGRTSMC
jgi:hypothetical protein